MLLPLHCGGYAGDEYNFLPVFVDFRFSGVFLSVILGYYSLNQWKRA
jgi:hypothetical protein